MQGMDTPRSWIEPVDPDDIEPEGPPEHGHDDAQVFLDPDAYDADAD